VVTKERTLFLVIVVEDVVEEMLLVIVVEDVVEEMLLVIVVEDVVEEITVKLYGNNLLMTGKLSNNTRNKPNELDQCHHGRAMKNLTKRLTRKN
jgi:hypothetical protein